MQVLDRTFRPWGFWADTFTSVKSALMLVTLLLGLKQVSHANLTSEAVPICIAIPIQTSEYGKIDQPNQVSVGYMTAAATRHRSQAPPLG